MARGLMVGVSALAALSGAVATGVYVKRNSETQAQAIAAADDGACVKNRVSLVEGMPQECLTSAQYEALRDRPVISADGSPITVNLIGAAANTETETVRNCVEYDARMRDGWYALTSADMRREEYYKRACVSLSLLVKAKPAQSTNFAGDHADAEDIKALAMGDAIGFAEVGAPVDVGVTSVADGVWKVTIGQGETMIYEIAHADFNGDGLGEILAYLSIGSVDGTARTGSVGFLEKRSPEGPCYFTAQ